MSEKKKAFGFSVMDIILLILVLACILSAVFRTQIQHFFGQEDRVQVEYTFLVQNASKDARNYPKAGEEIHLSDSFVSLGTIEQITRTEKEYQGKENPEDSLKLVNLTCKGVVTAYESEAGFAVGDVRMKPGAQLFVQTESASFTMVITMVKTLEN